MTRSSAVSTRQDSGRLNRLTRSLRAARLRFGDLALLPRARGSLRLRVLLPSLVGLLLAIVVLGLLGIWSIGESVERTLQERLSLSRAIAGNLDFIIADYQGTLQTAARGEMLDFTDGDEEPERRALAAALAERRFARVYLVDRSAAVIASAPVGEVGSLPEFSPLRDALATGLAGVITGHSTDESGKASVSFAISARGRAGESIGLLVGEVSLPNTLFQETIRPVGLGATTRIDVVDVRGVVLASTDDDYLFRVSDHRSQMAALIDARRPTVGTCHDCHVAAATSPEPTLMALAPLANASWAVVVREAEAEAFAPARQLERQIVLVAVPILLLAAAVGWYSGGRISRSVGALAGAAARITSGDLDSPVPSRGDDEIGRLGQTLEAMRERLRAVHLRERESNIDLERRVRLRTDELTRSESALQERNTVLSSLNDQLRRKEDDLAALLRRLISAQEEERRRIARDLHDETSQTLAAVLVAIESAATVPGTLAAERQLATARRLGERALDDVHKLVFDLRPSLLDDLGLVAALHWYAETRLEAVGVKVRFEVDGPARRLASEVETCIYRIVQESIANVARHASAENVLVRLEIGDHAVSVDVEDDGRGFDPEAIARHIPRADGGFGLAGMRERAGLIGGTIEVHSRPGMGTTIRLRVPLADSETASSVEREITKIALEDSDG